MIIYGSRAVHLRTVQSKNATCPSCKTQGSLIISVFRKHAHIFWIPLFPIGKQGVSQCQHCKSVLETREMPEPIKREYRNLKNEAKGPIWQFAGLALIAFLIAWSSFTSGENKKREQEYLASPIEGDIYEYKIETGSFSTFKVIGISKDSVFISDNEFKISKVSRLYKIDKPENYSEFSYGVSKNKLKEMYESGEIFDIKR